MFLSRKNQSSEAMNFNYLVWDVVWFGLGFSAINRFLSVYAIRLGADSSQLSLIAALPGAVLLIATGFSVWWRQRHRESRSAVLWPSFLFRLVFLLPAFAPFFPPELQPIWLICAVVLPALPQGISNSLFILLMRESVSEERFVSLQSQRMVAVNITLAVSAIGFGVMLEALPFPQNYQLMFVLAFIFALISHWQLTRLKVLFAEQPGQDKARDVWKLQGFREVAFAVLITHIAFFAAIMVIPEHLVQSLGAGEGFMAAFSLAELAAGAIMGMFTTQAVRRFGAPIVIGLSCVGLAASALVVAIAPSLYVTLLAAMLMGGSWVATNVGLFTLLAQRVPTGTQTSVAFQQMVSLGIFVGPLLGGMLIGTGMGLAQVLIIVAVLRLLTGYFTVNNPFNADNAETGHKTMASQRPRLAFAASRALNRKGRRR